MTLVAYKTEPLVPRISGRGFSFWPTPDAAVANLGEAPDTVLQRREKQRQRHLNGNGFGLRLTTAVQMWPSPNATDYTGPSTRSAGKERTAGLDDLPTRIGAQLSPGFVEWLMGFPKGHTELE